MDLVGFAWSGSFRLQFNNEANKHVSRKVFTILWDLLGGPSSLTGRSLHKLGFSLLLISFLCCSLFFSTKIRFMYTFSSASTSLLVHKNICNLTGCLKQSLTRTIFQYTNQFLLYHCISISKECARFENLFSSSCNCVRGHSITMWTR